MKTFKLTSLLFISVLLLIALPSCGSPKPGSSPKAADESEAMDFEPMTIERIKSPENITEAMWDETYNTNLLFKINRRVTYEGPQGQTAKVEISAEIPLFAQEEKDGAGFYGEGFGKAELQGVVPGAGSSEAKWDLTYWIYGWIEEPACLLELFTDEKWFEGEWCTTVLGITNCEIASGETYKHPYGAISFQDANLIGQADGLDALNFTLGPSTVETEISIVRTGKADNLPQLKECYWPEIEDDDSD